MKALMALSGGMDSTALLGWLVESGFEVQTISFYYGSKHNKYENKAALDVAGYYGVPINQIDISTMMEQISSNLLLSGGEIPEGHYEADNMKLTVVPCRNMIFLSILAGIAETRGIQHLAIGVHSGDHAIYPDCRESFIGPMSRAVSAATDWKIKDILVPFISSDKTKIIRQSCYFQKDVPFHLTRTCYKNQPLACGKCGSCTERLEAFKANEMDDPVHYETK